jgi:hypothetical protein
MFEEKRLARLLNEWMKRYIADPAGFQAEFQTVNQYLKEEAAGQEPSYGESCVAYLKKLDSEVENAGEIKTA